MKKQSKLLIGIIAAVAVSAVVIAIIIMTAAGGSRDAYSSHMELAQRYLDELQYEQAIAEFEAAIEIEPKKEASYIGLANAYIGLGDYESAVTALERGIEETDSVKLKYYRDVIQREWDDRENGGGYELDVYLNTDGVFDRNKYMFYDIETITTWEEAKTYCEGLGGHLAIITSEEENVFLYQLMIDEGYYSAYFGLTDIYNEDSWVWVDGTVPGYTNWHLGEPNSPNEHYGMFYSDYPDGTWNDGDFVNGTHVFICEWD